MPRWLLITGVVLGLFLAAPFVLGTAYAILGLPGYGVVCGDWTGILKGTVSPDSYRAFLMNRGCNVDATIRDILRDDFRRGDPDLVPMIRGERPPRASDEVAVRDGVRASLRTFRPISLCGTLNKKTSASRGVPPDAPHPPLSQGGGPQDLSNSGFSVIDECYRGMHQYFNDDLISKLFGAVTATYSAYVALNLNWSINAVVGFVGALAETGPLMPWLMILFVLALVWVGKLILETVRDLLKEALKKRLS